MSLPKQRIAILGAGLLGQLFAWRLLNQGQQVEIFEKDTGPGNHSAAWTAAAMLSPMSEVVISDRRIFDLGMRSIQLWQEWIKPLDEGGSLYQQRGSIILAHANDANELHQFYQELNFHLGNDNNAQWLERPALQNLESDLSTDFREGLYLPDEAHLNNRALLLKLCDLIQQEARIHWSRPVNIQDDADLLNTFDIIIDCRGVGARENQNTLRGVRGEVLHLHCPEIEISRPIRLMHPRYKLYLVPRPNKHFIIGATELESSDNSPMSVQSALELCSALYTLNPAFAEARITEMDANLRPALKDNMPAINETTVGDTPMISVNGLYRHGYLIAPALVEKVLGNL